MCRAAVQQSVTLTLHYLSNKIKNTITFIYMNVTIFTLPFRKYLHLTYDPVSLRAGE